MLITFLVPTLSSYKPKTSSNSDSASVNYGSHWSGKKNLNQVDNTGKIIDKPKIN